MPQLSFPSPLGDLTLSEEDGAIVSLDWGRGMTSTDTPLLVQAREQIDAYFDGRLTAFALPLSVAGTAFQRRVWAALEAIPYGATLTYGGLAQRLGSAPRAVGSACGRNPIPLIIPCHRVLGTRGTLCGYSGGDGIETKAWLLAHEQRHVR